MGFNALTTDSTRFPQMVDLWTPRVEHLGRPWIVGASVLETSAEEGEEEMLNEFKQDCLLIS